ncbi:MAG: lipoyl(octanoyl) transferase LipB [Gammaproteobacteria bacterium]
MPFMSALPRFTNSPDHTALSVRERGLADYAATWREMQAFTDTRTVESPDELWLLQHPPVITFGRNAKTEHLLYHTNDIPVIRVDRGGQVTYHGPGQLIAYLLLDLKRRRLGIQSLVRILEQSVIHLLADYSIRAGRRDKAPGVYVDGRKIAALGLRVRRGCCYHGLSLNVNMDLSPFSMINPCGFADLEVTQLAELGINIPLDAVTAQYRLHLERLLNGPDHE